MPQATSHYVCSPAFLFSDRREKVDLALHPNAGAPSSEPSTDTGTSPIEDIGKDEEDEEGGAEGLCPVDSHFAMPLTLTNIGHLHLLDSDTILVLGMIYPQSDRNGGCVLARSSGHWPYLYNVLTP